jgi:hypothetical protein
MIAVRTMDALTRGFYFCSNPDCVHGLHVRFGDGDIQGEGNWAELEGGILIGRAIIQGVYLCDGCARALLAGAVKLEIVAPAPPAPAVAPPVQQSLALTES